ncbi:hypothetical protein L195_g019040, partial [Trifolium pratense]
MHLKERLSRLNKGASPVSEYLNNVKAIADELAIINSPLDDIDLVIHTLNGKNESHRNERDLEVVQVSDCMVEGRLIRIDG